MSVMKRVEQALLLTGTVLLGTFLIVTVHSAVSAHLAIWRFEERTDTGGQAQLTLDEPPIFSQWAETRVAAYKRSLLEWATPAMALLRIDRLGLRVPVFEGTNELVLNRGAGWIVGTAKPGEPGNVGIAGHRDGFFRVLQDLQSGDRVEVMTRAATLTFTVDAIAIVDPGDVQVLDPGPTPSLTLVTCYPFYFVGSAPQRFIVHASIVETVDRNANALSAAAVVAGRSQEDKR
jgi:sortase A